MDGALDLFSLCFLVIFGNVLDFRTYSTPDGYPLKKENPYDANGITVDERYNMCTARGVCIELLRWWSSKYRMRHTNMRSMDTTSTMPRHAKTYDDFPIIFLLEESVLLLEYKIRAQRGGREGAPGCNASKLRDQILNVVYLFGEEANDHWDCLTAASSEFCDEQLSMGGPKKEYLEVVELHPPQVFGKDHFFFFDYCSILTQMAEPCKDYVQLGSTRLDIAFIKFLTKYPSTSDHVRMQADQFDF